MHAASEAVLDLMAEQGMDMRTAAYGVALRRLCAAISATGTAADFGG
jgi:glutamate dehydrogenase (NADP+)